MKKFFLFLLILAGLSQIVGSGCKEKQKTETSFIRIYRLRFSPEQPVVGQDLKLNIDYESPTKSKIGFDYRWYVNGKLVKEGKFGLLEGEKIVSGAEIYAEVQASDGTNQTGWIPTAKVKAREPAIKITKLMIEPENPNGAQTLSVQLECELCEHYRIYYRWFRNGQILEGQEDSELNGSAVGLKPGDEVKVEISPEPEYPKNWYESLPVKIANRIPEFSGEGKTWLEGNELFLKLSASDPDGGSLSYQLLEAPLGARIDSSGLIRWSVPQDFQGEVKFRVQVRDQDGGSNELIQSFSLSRTKSPTP